MIKDVRNVVRYIDYDILKIAADSALISVPVIIMQKYDASLAKKQENPEVGMFKKLFEFLLNTVHKIHEEGIIHRDIKPENILIDGDDFVLADFGIASYNPEIFQIRAETDKKERLGNRLFSAPEQEESGIEPHPTMDIYAIGQVLQCYITGKTHRGTGREQISNKFKGLELYDNIIERCLENSPAKRFQSILEIRQYIQNKKEKNAFDYLYLFNEICRMNFPKNDFRVLHSDNLDRIDILLSSFRDNEEEFRQTIWWHNGSGNFEFNLKQNGNGIWKFWDREFKVKEIWIHYDNSLFSDFILVHHMPNEPFCVEGQEKAYAIIVDGEHYISYSEFENGYAEINEEVVNLSSHQVELIHREIKEGYFFICNHYHCIFQTENDELVRQFIDQINTSPITNIEVIKDFERQTRRQKHPDVRMHL